MAAYCMLYTIYCTLCILRQAGFSPRAALHATHGPSFDCKPLMAGVKPDTVAVHGAEASGADATVIVSIAPVEASGAEAVSATLSMTLDVSLDALSEVEVALLVHDLETYTAQYCRGEPCEVVVELAPGSTVAKMTIMGDGQLRSALEEAAAAAEAVSPPLLSVGNVTSVGALVPSSSTQVRRLSYATLVVYCKD